MVDWPLTVKSTKILYFFMSKKCSAPAIKNEIAS